MVSWMDVGPCCNTACPMNSSCKKFCPPPRTIVEDDPQAILQAKCICTCYGMQHEFVGATLAQTPAASMRPAAGPSQPAAKPTTAPSSNKPYVSLGHAATDRKARMTDKLADGIKAKVYDPSYQRSKLGPIPRSARPRRPSPNRSQSARPPPPLPKEASVIELTVVLIPETSEVNDETCTMPTQRRMKVLHGLGYVVDLHVPVDASPSDLTRLIEAKFSVLPVFQSKQADFLLWRLLCIKAVGQGSAAQLVPHIKATNVTVYDFRVAGSSHRQATEFGKYVYIALSRNSIDLPLDTKDKPTKAESDSEFPLPNGKNAIIPNAPQKHLPFRGMILRNSLKLRQPKIGLNLRDPRLRRLLNEPTDFTETCASQRPGNKWPTHPINPYATPILAAGQIQRHLQNLQNPSLGEGNLAGVIFLVTFELFHTLTFVLDLPSEFVGADVPPKNFAVGAFGLEPIILVLYHFHRFLWGRSCDLPADEIQRHSDMVDSHGAAICSALLSFRSIVEREHYDPPDFIWMRKILRTRSHIFPIAESEQRFTVLGLSMFVDAPELFERHIDRDFNRDENGRINDDDCLIVGEHGLHGLMALVDYLLDDLPTEHESYQALFELFSGLCQNLGNRMNNYNKSHRKQKASNSGNRKGGSKPPSTSSSYNTRSGGSQESDSASVHEFEPTEEEREAFNHSHEFDFPEEEGEAFDRSHSDRSRKTFDSHSPAIPACVQSPESDPYHELHMLEHLFIERQSPSSSKPLLNSKRLRRRFLSAPCSVVQLNVFSIQTLFAANNGARIPTSKTIRSIFHPDRNLDTQNSEAQEDVAWRDVCSDMTNC
ncbi:hypothetical protein R3P38DRAFT_3245051 [Favolaschia claudopus]|uniref:Uncharacterized protein n=1 Tax=Favolaschia claudopus TaxID=2862362 RepID=A0AAV9Z1L1_9AGAR